MKTIKELKFTDIYCAPFHCDGCYIYSGANGKDDYSISALDCCDWDDHYDLLNEITNILNECSTTNIEVKKVENEYIHLGGEYDGIIIEVRGWGYLTSKYIKQNYEQRHINMCHKKLAEIQDNFAIWVATKLDKNFKV